MDSSLNLQLWTVVLFLQIFTRCVQLIRINEPDLVLFVGEALVGNEAVDQLVKFNQALVDQATLGSEARLIDGIILTKFDTIDDKVWLSILSDPTCWNFDCSFI